MTPSSMHSSTTCSCLCSSRLADGVQRERRASGATPRGQLRRDAHSGEHPVRFHDQAGLGSDDDQRLVGLRRGLRSIHRDRCAVSSTPQAERGPRPNRHCIASHRVGWQNETIRLVSSLCGGAIRMVTAGVMNILSTPATVTMTGARMRPHGATGRTS
jgi:hypothetical protein